MSTKKRYTGSLVSIICGIILIGICVPLLAAVRSILGKNIVEMKSASLMEVLNSVWHRIVNPFPINPDNFGAVALSVLGFLLFIAGAVLLISGICKFFSVRAHNTSGKMSYVPPFVMFAVSAFLGYGVYRLFTYGMYRMNTVKEHYTHPFVYAGILLVICVLLFIASIKKLQKASAHNGAVNSGTINEGLERSMGMRATNMITNGSLHLLLIVMSIVWLIPFVCIILQSFRVETAMPVGYIWPQKWGFDNYAKLLKTDFPKWYLNTFIIAIFTAVLQTVIVLCMSYVLSRFRFKMRKLLMKFMLVLGFFPGILSMIILYRVLKDLGLTQENAVPGLILVYVASSGMGYYVSKGFFDTLPKSLDEAALVDGATRAQILFKIILPLAKPIVIYTVLTAFMAPWGDFVFARYISMNTSAGMNVAVGLNSWLSLDQINNNYTMFCAGGVVVAIPVTILFLCMQRYYVEGVTGGAVKG